MPGNIYRLSYQQYPEEVSSRDHCSLTSHGRTVCRRMAVHDLVRIRLLARNGSCLVLAFRHRLPCYRLHQDQIQI